MGGESWWVLLAVGPICSSLSGGGAQILVGIFFVTILMGFLGVYGKISGNPGKSFKLL